MNELKDRKARARSIAPIVRAAIVALCLIWFCRFAYVRVTTLPPALERGASATTPDDDDTAELAAAIARLPIFTGPATTTAPAVWMGGRTELSDALAGEWTPQTRPFLTSIIKHITSPKVDRVLDDLVEVSGKRWTMSVSFGFGQPAFVTPWQLEEPIDALLVRARHRHTERGDVTGALSDLLAALRLCAPPELRIGYWGSYGQASAVADEIWYLATEHEIPLDESAAFLEFVRSELPHSISIGMLAGMNLQGTAEQILDRFYTDDGDGDGWIVLSEVAVLNWDTPMGSDTRSRCWNVLSPLFNGRAAISRKFQQYFNEFLRIDTLGFDAGLDAFEKLQERRLFNVTDGPFVRLSSGMNQWSFQQAVRDVLENRTTIIVLALSAFKHDRGTYPDSLDEMVPFYLRDVPLDVLTAKPFEYKRTDDGFILNEGQELPAQLSDNSYPYTAERRPKKAYERSRRPPLRETAPVGGN